MIRTHDLDDLVSEIIGRHGSGPSRRDRPFQLYPTDPYDFYVMLPGMKQRIEI
jgi:hypothetical protein